MPFIDFDWRYRKIGIDEQKISLFDQTNKKDKLAAISAGVVYTSPMLINVRSGVYHDGIFRLSIMREDIPVSKRLRAGFMADSDFEYMADLRYILTRYLGIGPIMTAIWALV